MSVGTVQAARRRSGLRLTPRAAILGIVVTLLLLYLLVPVRTWMQQRDRLNQLEQQSRIIDDQNEQLRKQIARLHDPAYLERLARECLGMVKPGEIGFVVVPKGGREAPPAC